MINDLDANATVVEDLFKVPSITVYIASLLNTKDYINFRQVNKRVYHEVLTDDLDRTIWMDKLTVIGLSKSTEAGEVDKKDEIEQQQELLIEVTDQNNDIDATNVFDRLSSFTDKNAKDVFKLFFDLLEKFYSKLYHNNMSHFFPAKYEKDPLSQAKILNNIQRYNKCNINDIDYYTKIEQNLVILKEIFINSVLQEAERTYQNADYKSTATFISVLLLLNEEVYAVEFYKSKIDYTDFENWLPEGLLVKKEEKSNTSLLESETELSKMETSSSNKGDDQVIFDYDKLSDALEKLQNYLNDNIDTIDILFGNKYPMILNIIETFIQEVILTPINQLLGDNEEYIVLFFPRVYTMITKMLCKDLHDSINGGETFHKVVKEFLNIYLTDNIVKYLNLTPMYVRNEISKEFKAHDEKVRSEEMQKNEEIYNSLRNQSEIGTDIGTDKNDFLSSFTKLFKMSNAQSDRQNMEDQLKLAYNLNTISNNLKNIKTLVSLDLCYKVVQLVKEKIDEVNYFTEIDTIANIVKTKCQALFKILVNELCEAHVKPAFEKGTKLLQQYDPNEIDKIDINLQAFQTAKVEPLVNFTELMNICDIILQMISIFYKNELLGKNIIDKNRDFLNDVVQAKKKFETVVDDYVAEGLNIGISKLMDKINFVFNTVQLPDDFNPEVGSSGASTLEIKPTQCAMQVVELLENHCFLLNGATDKGTVDVYQQEIGERFFNEVAKHIKGSLISEDGGIILICDLNYYYDFFSKKLRQKSLVRLYQGLKNIGQLYIISGKDSKDLGKMISDLGKFQGLFTQEEIYEFVQRRADWIRVKRDVEKVMYGLGVKDCVIM